MIKTVFRAIARVFQFIRATILNILIVLLLIGIIIALAADDGTPTVPSSAALVFNPTGDIVERPASQDPFTQLFFQDLVPLQTSMVDIKRVLRHAADDERIKILLLDFSRVTGVNLSQVQQIREAISKFKEQSGKPVWAHSQNLSQSQYLLLLEADVISLDPLGELLLTGVSMTTTYYKGLLDKLNIDMEVAVQGDYKSAVEPYLRTSMSDAVKERNLELINHIWGMVANEIKDARNLNSEDVADYSQRIHQYDSQSDVSFADVALSNGLVDYIQDRADFRSEYRSLLSQSPKSISFNDYLTNVIDTPDFFRPKVAVLTIEGPILGLTNVITESQSETVRLIERASKNTDIKAMVLQVNSPGGSVFESEYIRRALARFKETGKPLVASFTGTAASGGYWVALPAEEIYASPMTITGSIGVFSIFPTLQRSLDGIGITSESLTTTPYANTFDPFINPTDELKQVRQLQVDRYYSKFVKLVADSRRLSEEDVRKVAGGRVWLAEEAVEAKLIDEIGTLEDAVARVANIASLSTYRVEFLRHTESPFVALGLVMSELKSAYLNAEVPIPSWLTSKAREIQQLTESNGVFAWCNHCDITP